MSDIDPKDFKWDEIKEQMKDKPLSKQILVFLFLVFGEGKMEYFLDLVMEEFSKGHTPYDVKSALFELRDKGEIEF